MAIPIIKTEIVTGRITGATQGQGIKNKTSTVNIEGGHLIKT